MHFEPRTIALSCELVHPPVQPNTAPIQELHNELFADGNPAYQSFTVTPQGPVLSNPVPRPGIVSSVSFLPDRLRFREDQTALTVDDFAERVEWFAKRVATLRGIQIFTAQVVIIRFLVNPRAFRDARAFLQHGVFGFEEELGAFERPPQVLGMRLAFPPAPDEPNAFTLRVESFAQDPRSVFMENQGGFGPQVVERGLEDAGANVMATYDFMNERALQFLSMFDVRLES